MKLVFGGLALLLGTLLLGWIGYNLLVELQPEAKRLNPLPALIFSGALIGVGVKWVSEGREDIRPKRSRKGVKTAKRKVKPTVDE